MQSQNCLADTEEQFCFITCTLYIIENHQDHKLFSLDALAKKNYEFDLLVIFNVNIGIQINKLMDLFDYPDSFKCVWYLPLILQNVWYIVGNCNAINLEYSRKNHCCIHTKVHEWVNNTKKNVDEPENRVYFRVMTIKTFVSWIRLA